MKNEEATISPAEGGIKGVEELRITMDTEWIEVSRCATNDEIK
jgi:hypothetical protein